MKLNNKAEYMKVKITQEDTLHNKMFFYHMYYQLLLPFHLITMQAYDVAKRIYYDSTF